MNERKEGRNKEKEEKKNISKSGELNYFILYIFEVMLKIPFKILKWPGVPIVSQGGHSGEKGLKKKKA